MTHNIKKIEDIIYLHFGIRPKSVTPILIGVMTYKFEIEINKEYYIVRVYPDNRKHIARIEFEILKLASKNNCKVPEVLFVNDYLDLSYIIYKKLPGLDLSQCYNEFNTEEKDAIMFDIAENIYKFSNILFGHYGDIFQKNDWHESWQSFLINNVNEGLQNAKNNIYFQSNNREKMNNLLLGVIAKINISSPAMVWADFSQENIIVHNGKLQGFIDFESCIAGDPCLSVGYLFAREGDSDFFLRLKQHLKKYFKFNDELLSFYGIIRFFRIIKYLNQPLPSGEKREDIFIYFRGLDKCIRMFN